MLTQVQIYWHGKINQLLQTTKRFLTSSLLTASRFAYCRFVALLLENLWHPGYVTSVQKLNFSVVHQTYCLVLDSITSI